jgi:5-formyltetrahydrofolate cyclo-ligase
VTAGSGLEEAARAKQAIRERVWALLERERAARFPGATGRIPNFAGASAAAARLASLAAWQAAGVVKSNPDAPSSRSGPGPWPTASSCTWPSPA